MLYAMVCMDPSSLQERLKTALMKYGPYYMIHTVWPKIYFSTKKVTRALTVFRQIFLIVQNVPAHVVVLLVVVPFNLLQLQLVMEVHQNWLFAQIMVIPSVALFTVFGQTGLALTVSNRCMMRLHKNAPEHRIVTIKRQEQENVSSRTILVNK